MLRVREGAHMTSSSGFGTLRLHRHRRRLGRLRPCQPADRIGPPPRAAAGSRRPRPPHVDPHSARLRQAVQQRQGQLALQERTRAGAQQPPGDPAARQGAGWVELDQRPALYPRPKGGFRPLASARQHRLGIRRRAPLFPPRRGPGARRRRTARRRRSAHRVQRLRAASAMRSVPHRGRTGRHSAQ